MKLHELASVLTANPDRHPRFIFPDGATIPGHFHITEVGHVSKRFIDCGGKLQEPTETCVLQTHVAGDVDHRLTGAVFAKILDIGRQVLPHDKLEVEIEYDRCVLSQYPITSAAVNREHIDFHLARKETECLAKGRSGIEEGGCCGGEPGELSNKAGAVCC